MTKQGPEHLRLRLVFLGMLIVSLFSVLTFRLWFLQVLAHQQYQEAAQVNELRLVPLEPARGEIHDRQGRVLARNRASRVVSVRLDEMEDPGATLERLGELLGMSRQEINERLADRRFLPYTPVPIKEDVDEDLAVFIMERPDQFQGVIIETRPFRLYPHKELASHLLGYVGEITAEQMELSRYEGYRPGTIVGRSGLEYAYESELRGIDGLVKYRVDSSGKVLDPREGLGRREPQRGYTLVTSIDLELQRITEESLRAGIEKARTIFNSTFDAVYEAPAGAAVVLDPRNGEVLAMASFPTYDPNAFAGGISEGDFRALQDHPHQPLLNRGIQAQFPVGSTFKVVTAAAALQEGVASARGTYHCSTTFRYADRTFRNWRSVDSGFIGVPQALVESCNTVFFRFGAEFYRIFRDGGDEKLQDYARAFGFGEKSGVDLGEPFEKAGIVPDVSWLQESHESNPEAFPYRVWLPGYTINLSIGQGDFKATPLQLANAYAAIANGGTLWSPHLGLRIVDGEKLVSEISPEAIRKLPVSVDLVGVIQSGLEQVTTRGTGRGSFNGFPLGRIPVAAKTGTAELQTVPPSLPYAWFVAYAPADDPRYLVVVMLEKAGHGSESAAPIVRRILEGAFGLPLSELTPGPRTDL